MATPEEQTPTSPDDTVNEAGVGEVTFAELDSLGLETPAEGKQITLEIMYKVMTYWPKSKQLRVVDSRGEARNVFMYFEEPEPHFDFEDMIAGNVMTVQAPRAHVFMDQSLGLRLDDPKAIRVIKKKLLPETRIRYAEAEKADGTLCFGKKKWEMAADRYGYGLQQLDEINSEAVSAEVVEKRNVLATALHLNAAAGTLNMKKYKEAIYNCNKALALNPASAKAYFRMAEAQHATEELENAEQNYAKALELSPEDKGIKKALAAVRREIAERNAVQSSMFKGMFAKK